MNAILDTSFLFALTDKSDRNHVAVLTVAQTLSDHLILPIVVLPEICYLIASRLGHSAMRSFLQNLAIGNITMETLSIQDLQRVNSILEQYADSHLDFTDAAIVATAERLNITRILTLDRRDFLMIRPNHCNSFDVLP